MRYPARLLTLVNGFSWAKHGHEQTFASVPASAGQYGFGARAEEVLRELPAEAQKI